MWVGAGADDRNGARTHIAWDGSGFGVFSIIGYHMYFVRTDAAGQILVPLMQVTTAFSQHFSGQFKVLYKNGAYFVVYPEQSMMAISFMKVGMDGAVMATAPIVSGFDIRHGDMFEMNGLFYVLTNDAAKNAVITVLDENANVVKGMGGVIGEGPMPYPVVAYDAATGDIGVAYNENGWNGPVMFRKFSAMP